jgi:hypothetical protein
MKLHEGPTIDDLLADPLIRAVMRADHVELLALRSQMTAAAARIAAGKARSPSSVAEEGVREGFVDLSASAASTKPSG